MVIKINNLTEKILKIKFSDCEIIINPQATGYVNTTVQKIDLLVTEVETKTKNLFINFFSYIICCIISFIVVCTNCFEFPVVQDFFIFPTKMFFECSQNTEINLISTKKSFNICSFQMNNDVFEGESVLSEVFYTKNKKRFLKEIFQCTTFPLCLFIFFSIVGVLKKEWSMFGCCFLIFFAIVFFIAYYYKKSLKSIQLTVETHGNGERKN